MCPFAVTVMRSTYHDCYVHHETYLLLAPRHSCCLDRQLNISFLCIRTTKLFSSLDHWHNRHICNEPGSDTILSVVVIIKDSHIPDSVISMKRSESSSFGYSRVQAPTNVFLYVEDLIQVSLVLRIRSKHEVKKDRTQVETPAAKDVNGALRPFEKSPSRSKNRDYSSFFSLCERLYYVAPFSLSSLSRLLLLLLDGLFAALSRSPHSCSCSCSDADPARPVSDGEEAATARWTVNGLFGCDVGLDSVCDERGGGGFEWECGPEVAAGG
jgi:hypothetical protein